MYILLVRKDSTFDIVALILLGTALMVYGLFAKKFTESKKLHILTPADKLERYVPSWYHRLFFIALGLALVVFEVT